MENDPKVRAIVSRIKKIDWKAVDAAAKDSDYPAPVPEFDGEPRPKNVPRAPEEPPRDRSGIWHNSTGKRRSFIRP